MCLILSLSAKVYLDERSQRSANTPVFTFIKVKIEVANVRGNCKTFVNVLVGKMPRPQAGHQIYLDRELGGYHFLTGDESCFWSQSTAIQFKAQSPTCWILARASATFPLMACSNLVAI